MKLLCAVLKPRPKCNRRIDLLHVSQDLCSLSVYVYWFWIGCSICVCFLPLWFQHPGALSVPMLLVATCCCCCFSPPSWFNLCCCVVHACSVVFRVKCSLEMLLFSSFPVRLPTLLRSFSRLLCFLVVLAFHITSAQCGWPVVCSIIPLTLHYSLKLELGLPGQLAAMLKPQKKRTAEMWNNCARTNQLHGCETNSHMTHQPQSDLCLHFTCCKWAWPFMCDSDGLKMEVRRKVCPGRGGPDRSREMVFVSLAYFTRMQEKKTWVICRMLISLYGSRLAVIFWSSSFIGLQQKLLQFLIVLWFCQEELNSFVQFWKCLINPVQILPLDRLCCLWIL